MPYSRDTFDADVQALMGRLPIATCLDVGAGAGKHGRMVRAAHPEAHITGVEIVTDYITRFKLTDIYSVVHNANVTALLADPDVAYDMVIMGDVLEHLRKSDGVDILHFMIYRCKWLLAIYPEWLRQNSVEGYKAEAHRAHWFPDDFVGFDHAMKRRDGKAAVVINGLLRGPDDMDICAVWRGL